jgi:predicted RNA-binding Zn ribbon-like protein
VKNRDTEKFYLIGNNLALDFINTAMFEITVDNLTAWVIGVGLGVGRTLNQEWSDSQLGPISEFRDRLRAIVEQLALRRDIKQSDIDLINGILRRGGRFVELQRTADGFSKRLEIDISDPRMLMVPMAESLVDLLVYGNLDYLRRCENPDCILYFYDTTKNHRRRWCSMAVCGNRAKANKFYYKQKELAT